MIKRQFWHAGSLGGFGIPVTTAGHIRRGWSVHGPTRLGGPSNDRPTVPVASGPRHNLLPSRRLVQELYNVAAISRVSEHKVLWRPPVCQSAYVGYRKTVSMPHFSIQNITAIGFESPC